MTNTPGRPIRARRVRVGDVVMNEWSRKTMTVQKIDNQIYNGRRRDIHLFCVKEDGKQETLIGGYWHGMTWLVERPAARVAFALLDLVASLPLPAPRPFVAEPWSSLRALPTWDARDFVARNARGAY